MAGVEPTAVAAERATPLASFRDLTLAAFVDRLASAEPVPGGGSASAVAGALAAALVTMVARLSEGRPAYAEHEATIRSAGRAGAELAGRFLDLADADAAAYARLAAAFRAPRATADEKAEREELVRASAREAAGVPLDCLGACLELLRLTESLAGRSNRNAASDLAVASLLGEAAAEGAARNVAANLPFVADEAFETEARVRTTVILSEVHALGEAVRRIVDGGGQRPAATAGEPRSAATARERQLGPIGEPPADVERS